jgi:hypothetical protein
MIGWVKIDLRETRCKGVDWTQLAQEGVQCRAAVCSDPSGSSAEPHESEAILSHTLFCLRSILIISPHLRVSLASGLFQFYGQNTNALHMSSIRSACHAHLIRPVLQGLLGVGKCWVTGHAALPYCSLLGTAFSISDCIVSNNWMIQLMIWEGCGRKWLWLNFKASSRHLPVRAERNHENHVSIAGLRAEILTRDLPSTKQEC